MPRPMRTEYPGAIYHVMNRGDRREAIYRDDEDRATFLRTLGEACGRTGWQVHAWCLMGNHFHLVLETPQANLVAGMRWLLGTFTGRFNRRHGLSGNLFGGRYKAQHIDERSGADLVTACDDVHLNPARAGLVRADEPLETRPWSSYPAYLRPRVRTAWLRLDRAMGEHGRIEGAGEGRSAQGADRAPAADGDADDAAMDRADAGDGQCKPFIGAVAGS